MTVARTCTVVHAPRPEGDEPTRELGDSDSRPLSDFRSCDAYVLLGDPGAGKTTAFGHEAGQLGDEAHLVSARDFLELGDPESLSTDRTLFIDGLDEVRAGQQDARSPFDRIRRQLRALGQPRFRLSCRAADWLGDNDRRHLARVAPGGTLIVLRLDPLTERDIRMILAGRSDIASTSEFIATARERGLDGLLTNPQTLDLLIRAVAGGDEWPAGRLETFEEACLRMAREHNKEHLAAAHGQPSHPPEELLDAAGRLCAVQLLTGAAGFSVRGEGGDGSYLDPDRCDYASPPLLRPALSTKLFAGHGDGHLTPIHRHIAEFLAARYLARLVEQRKLPVSRIVALIVGEEDGTVVSEMRGLSAWLAAHCPAARPHLIDRDPVGVGEYGDIRGFGHQDKRALLQSLGRDLPWHQWSFGLPGNSTALATSDMAEALRDIVDSPNRGAEQQARLALLLQALAESDPLPGLSDGLLRVVRDPTRWPRIRKDALRQYARSCRDTSTLRSLLDDVRQGRLYDPDDDLRGVLLDHLYPGGLSTSELWELFAEPRNGGYYGLYLHFWNHTIADRSPDADVAMHLDHLARRPRSVPTHEGPDRMQTLRRTLLARGLAVHGDDLVRRGEIARLHGWLEVAAAETQLGANSDGRLKEIREWLATRPHVQKAVMLKTLERHFAGDALAPSSRKLDRSLLGSGRPRDFGSWCLDQAVGMEQENPHAAEYLLDRAFWALGDDRVNQGLSLDVIEKRVRHSDRLRRVLEGCQRTKAAWARSDREQDETERRERRKRRGEKEGELAYLRSQAAALARNDAPAGLLYNLARIYFGDFTDIAADLGAGARAIERRCDGDGLLAEAVLSAFRGVASRPDKPTWNEVVRLCRDDRLHYLGLPFLAGLAEAERAAPGASSIPQDGHLAVVFLFSSYHWDYQPEWYRTLLERQPEVIADMQVRLAPALFRGDGSIDLKLGQLASDPRYAKVARQSALRLLRAFPTQAKRALGRQLDHLLIAGLGHADRSALRDIIDAKLSRSSLGVWQSVHWLAAGLLAWPGSFADALRDEVKGREGRLAELSSFALSLPPGLADGLDRATVQPLVQLLGGSVGPERFSPSPSPMAQIVTPSMERSQLVGNLIDRLSRLPASEARDALEELLADPTLSAWRHKLHRAREAQRILRRDHGYRHPGIDAVTRTLSGAEPANITDLAALAEHHIREMSEEIRRSDVGGWERYWNQDGHSRPIAPKSENSCRNGVAAELGQRLPPSVEVSLEAHHAGANRSDLQVSHLGPEDRRFHLPIEIKKSDHRALWTAIGNQLIPKYTIDPAAGGHGIYLVLWFGSGDAQRSPTGDRPRSTKELERSLRASLSETQRRKIAVCVVDVTPP